MVPVFPIAVQNLGKSQSGLKKSHITLMEFGPPTFQLAFQTTNHCTLGAGIFQSLACLYHRGLCILWDREGGREALGRTDDETKSAQFVCVCVCVCMCVHVCVCACVRVKLQESQWVYTVVIHTMTQITPNHTPLTHFKRSKKSHPWCIFRSEGQDRQLVHCW